MSKLIINAPSNLAESCAEPGSGSSRYSPECVAYYPRCALAVATNGRMASVVNLEERATWDGEADAPERVLIDPRAFIKGKPTPTGKPGKPIEFNAPDFRTASVGKDTYRSDYGPECAFPPVSDVLKPNVDGYTVMGVNPELLLKLARSLNSGTAVTLLIDPENRKPMIMLPDEPHSADGLGILMPRTIGKVTRSGSVGGAAETVRHETSERIATFRTILAGAERNANYATP